jgi:hypothetical protein
VAAAPAAELRDDPRLRAAYLGATDPSGKPVATLPEETR